MRIRENGVLLIAMIALCAAGLQAQTTEETKSELRLKRRIEQLTKTLKESKLELAEAQFKRGVDTVTVVKTPEPTVVEKPQEVEPIEIAAEQRDFTLDFTPLQMDSLLNDWRERESQDNFDNFFDRYINFDEADELAALEACKGNKKALATATDSLYVSRLQRLASPIELPYNAIIKSYIDRYISPRSRLMSSLLARSKYYFPMIEDELMKQDIPVELRGMAIIESALNAGAVSRAGAMGLWQFMPSTGKHYGLEVNYLVDERCDPAKSTVAACRFMSDLYEMFGDWTLAIAAYNCGPGNVNKALARSGLEKGTFWDIYHFLPRETRGYVPAFIGASYGYAYHKHHGIEAATPSAPLATDTVTVNRIMHIGQVAQILELPIEIIRELNPQYRRDIIPATTKSYSLRLPQKYVGRYIQNEAAIHAKDTLFLKQYINPTNIEKLKSMPSGTIYVVRRGDTLGGIANKYGTSTRQLMVWNNIRSAHKISIGQKLRVR